MPKVLYQLTPEVRERVAERLNNDERPELLALEHECSVSTIRNIGYQFGVLPRKGIDSELHDALVQRTVTAASRGRVFGRLTPTQVMEIQADLAVDPDAISEWYVREGKLSEQEVAVLLRTLEEHTAKGGRTLSPEQAQDARIMRMNGVTVAALAAIYNVSNATISRMV
jgi:hypothetical protein